jgi:hypothetical protein
MQAVAACELFVFAVAHTQLVDFSKEWLIVIELNLRSLCACAH